MAQVKLHYSAFTQLRGSQELQEAITQTAERIAQEANRRAIIKGARYTAMPAQRTDHGAIALATTSHGSEAAGKAMADQARYKTLSGVVGA